MLENEFIEREPSALESHGKDIIVTASKASFYTPLMGPTNDDVIKTQLVENANGSKNITMSLRGLLRGGGVKGNTDLEANRDKLKYIYQVITGDILANSIKSQHKKINSKTIAKEFRNEAKEGLADWFSDTINRIRTAKLSANCTNIVSLNAAGEQVETSALEVGDTFNTASITELLNRAENGYEDADGVKHPRIRPYKTEKRNIKGQETEVGFYLIRIGKAAKKTLKEDPLWVAYQETLAQSTQANGEFITSGQIGEFETAIIVSNGNWDDDYEGVVTSKTPDFEDYAGGFSDYAGNGGIETEVNLLLGATAGLQPFAAIPDYLEDSADSGRKMISAIDTFFGFEKAKFMGKTAEEKKLVWHGKDYGVIACVQSIK